MKLVDICAKELTEWPELHSNDFKVKWLVQNANGEISGWEQDGDLVLEEGKWDILRSCPVDYYGVADLAEDYATAKVTYEDYRRATAKKREFNRAAALADLVRLIDGAATDDKTIAQAIYDAGYRKP